MTSTRQQRLLTMLKALEGKPLNTHTIAAFAKFDYNVTRMALNALLGKGLVYHDYVFDMWGANL